MWIVSMLLLYYPPLLLYSVSLYYVTKNGISKKGKNKTELKQRSRPVTSNLYINNTINIQL